MKTLAALVWVGLLLETGCTGMAGSPPADGTFTLSHVAVSYLSAHSAIITWDTSEPATATVGYGLTADEGTTIPVANAASTHTATLSGLDAMTTYHYQVKAKNAAGAVVSSGDLEFTTAAAGTSPGDGGELHPPADGGSCTPQCGQKQCGDDGCGGSCGSCGAPQTCGGSGMPGVCSTASHSCGMQLNDNPVSFCETFDQPHPVTNRSGEMDGALWGVQRTTGDFNYGRPAAWANAQLDLCGTPIGVKAESDIRVCNGQMREATDDNLPGMFEAGGVTALTMYSKQPFDFTGRTGTVSFDVTNDSAGAHSSWPEFWMTDQPVPAPFIHFGSFISHPKHGFAVRMANAVIAGQQGECPNANDLAFARWTVDSAAVIRDYVMEDTVGCGLGAATCVQTGLKVNILDCVTEDPAGPNGGFNHVELRISQSTIDVYATNAGTTAPLKQIASITGANLGFSNGVIWVDDVHYNADKGPTERPSQRVHTFAWDNIAFDGPLLARHLSFDVLDSLVTLNEGTGGVLLGWDSTPTQPMSVTTLPMTASQISAASGALLLFDFWAERAGFTFDYTINGHAHTYAWPFPDTQAWTVRTLAIPIDTSELVAGSNAITLGVEGDYGEWTNVNIALLDAGGVVAPVLGGP